MGWISDLREYWRKHGWYILIILIVLTFLILFVINYFSEKNQYGTTITWNDIYEHVLWVMFRPIDNPAPRRARVQRSSQTSSRGEELCKSFAEFYFQRPFHKTRPDFLKNPVTGENLELDLYNP